VLGVEPARLPPAAFDDPLAALEQAVLPALRRAPCLVSFSGGRDSSAVLAVAARLARREQLPLPIPATNRFPGHDDTEESEWQERVVAHLRLDDWIRVDARGDLDCLGPVARRVLRRHGLLWPCNAHFHVPLFEAARGGSLLTGVGGDEVFTDSQWSHALGVMGGAVRPQPRDVLPVGLALAPRPLRRTVLRRRTTHPCSWLRPDASKALRNALADQAADEPLRWASRLRWRRGLRYLEAGDESLRLLAGDADVRLLHPLLDEGFCASLSALPRRERFADRTEGMRRLFGELLPAEVLARRTKASFDSVFWADESRAFAERWQGEAVDEDIVDAEELAAAWRGPEPDPRSFTLLQAVWLALDERAGGSAPEPVEQVLDGAGK
jgi:asparagine synthetase B (glutamine-hydrolysing)